MRACLQELQKRCNAAEALSTNGDLSVAKPPKFNTSAPNEDVSGSHKVTENPLFGEVWHPCVFFLSLVDVLLLLRSEWQVR